MNTFNSRILNEFRSSENKQKLLDKLNDYFGDSVVSNYLKANFNADIERYCYRLDDELNVSDPIPGVTVREQVSTFNNQFIQDRISFIAVYILGAEANPIYSVSDGAPTTRTTLRQHQQAPGRVLERWYNNSASSITLRSDTESDVYPNNTYSGDAAMCDKPMETGITFSDQGNRGQDPHITQLFDSMFNALNPGPVFGNGAVGWSTPQSDERLLSRRIFRSYDGNENSIPFYERALYKRQLDRNPTEGLRASERDYRLYAHDTDELYTRLDQRKKYKANRECQLNDWEVKPGFSQYC